MSGRQGVVALALKLILLYNKIMELDAFGVSSEINDVALVIFSHFVLLFWSLVFVLLSNCRMASKK